MTAHHHHFDPLIWLVSASNILMTSVRVDFCHNQECCHFLILSALAQHTHQISLSRDWIGKDILNFAFDNGFSLSPSTLLFQELLGYSV